MAAVILLPSPVLAAVEGRTWGVDYQRTRYNTAAKLSLQPLYWVPQVKVEFRGLQSYTAPVQYRDNIYAYLYNERTNTGYLYAFHLPRLLSGDATPLWTETFVPGDQSKGVVQCLTGNPNAHCGRARSVAGPSIFEYQGRAYLAIGVGAQMYVYEVTGDGKEQRRFLRSDWLINKHNPRRLNQISMSPGYADGWVMAGSWNGVVRGWHITCFINPAQQCKSYTINLVSDFGSSGIITSSPSYDPRRRVWLWGVDPDGWVMETEVETGRTRRIARTRFGISSSIVVGPNGMYYIPDKKGWTYLYDPARGRITRELYCGLEPPTASTQSQIRNIAVTPHGVYAITDRRRSIGWMDLSLSQCRALLLPPQLNGFVDEYASPTVAGDVVLIAFRGRVDEADRPGDAGRGVFYGGVMALTPGPEMRPRPVFIAPAVRTSIARAYAGVADYQSPVVVRLPDGQFGLAMQFTDAVRIWLPARGIAAALSIDGMADKRKLIAGQSHMLWARVTNIDIVPARNVVADIDLGGQSLVFTGQAPPGCTVLSPTRARCTAPSIEGVREGRPLPYTEWRIPVRAVSPGQQTIRLHAEAERDRRPLPDTATARLDVRVVAGQAPPGTPPYVDDPNIVIIPPRPSTVRERGRVRAELRYAPTPERVVSEDHVSREGYSCLRERVTEYTRPDRETGELVRVEYTFYDVDGRPLSWPSEVDGRELGHGLARRREGSTTVWVTPQVGYRRAGMGMVEFRTREDRWQRVERWRCEERWSVEVVTDDRGQPVLGPDGKPKTRRVFEGYERTYIGTDYRDVADIVREFRESVPVTAIGTIIGK